MADTAELLKQQDKDLFDEINKYIDELKGEAKGDYDFVVKFLKRQFESALGTDNQARAEFFSKVANQLEARIGRIPFDYETKTDREKQDIANYLSQKDQEDTRQRQQEQEFQTQQDMAIEQEQKQVRQSANARGMLDSGIEKRQSQEVQKTRDVNVIQPQQSQFAYQQGVRDTAARLAQLQSGRNLEDITTEARRAGQDSQYDFDYASEKSSRTLEQRLAEIERTKKSQMRSGLALQTTETMGNF